MPIITVSNPAKVTQARPRKILKIKKNTQIKEKLNL